MRYVAELQHRSVAGASIHQRTLALPFYETRLLPAKTVSVLRPLAPVAWSGDRGSVPPFFSLPLLAEFLSETGRTRLVWSGVLFRSVAPVGRLMATAFIGRDPRGTIPALDGDRYPRLDSGRPGRLRCSSDASLSETMHRSVSKGRRSHRKGRSYLRSPKRVAMSKIQSLRSEPCLSMSRKTAGLFCATCF